MKKLLAIMLCAVIAFAFAACKNDETEGIKTDSGGVSQQSGDASSETSEADSKGATGAQSGSEEKDVSLPSTTTPMPSTEAKDAIPISVDDATLRLSKFYGSAYHVEEKVEKNSVMYYEVRDNLGNLYAKVEVNLKTSDAKETVEHSGEVNTFNLLV